MSKHVFYGPLSRVQLVVYDFTTADTPPAMRRERPTYHVSALDDYRHKKTPFCHGDQLYHGDDPDAAWDAMHKRVPNLATQCPQKLRRFLLKWGRP